MSASVRQRYVCEECGSAQMVKIDAQDRDKRIRYKCDECRGVRKMRPRGMTDWFKPD